MEDGSREKSNKGKIGWKKKYQMERELSGWQKIEHLDIYED